MKIPKGHQVKIETCYFDGPLRPKTFWCVTLYNAKEHDKSFVQYVLQNAFFPRIRLWLALRDCIVMHRKFAKFATHHNFE